MSEHAVDPTDDALPLRLTPVNVLEKAQQDAEHATPSWMTHGTLFEWQSNVEAALRHLGPDGLERAHRFREIPWSREPKSTIADALMPALSSLRPTFSSSMATSKAHIRAALTSHYLAVGMGSDQSMLKPGVSMMDPPILSPTKVFLVHGHNGAMKHEVARFVEKLKLDAIILDEQASGGLTIIEKFERHSDVGFAIVLLTADDVGAAKAKRDELQPRARQNVILELGYFYAKLGRGRVVPLVEPGLELPSDLSGIVYVANDRDWRTPLLKELRTAGLDVDANDAL